jgi:general secretion pathway protein C
MDWASKKVQEPGFAFYGKLATVVLSNYFLSDISSLMLGNFIPDPGPNSFRSSRYNPDGRADKTVADYHAIAGRNLFNSKGLIPGDDENPNPDSNATPVKTQLPFNLVGTLIMTNPLHSLATIEDKSLSSIYPVGVDDEIPGKAKIQSIEPRKVIFFNKTSGRREYVEIPEDVDTGRGSGLGGGMNPNQFSGVEKLSPSQFNVSRIEVDKALSDFNNILTQARAIPNTENGVAAGYKLFQIVPGSIYDKLGLKNGDVITGLNGQTINDPGKAFEMLNELKTANHLELQIKQEGKPLNYVYDIR